MQSLRQSSPPLYQLLTIFSSGALKDYRSFISTNSSYLSTAKPKPLSEDALLKKIRLLTLQELASSTPSRSIPYSDIADTLEVSADDVEIWIIDCIRVGLVEGRMSQREKVFLVNGWKSRGRQLKKDDWIEIQDRLNQWKQGLKGVLEVVKRGREEAAEAKLGGSSATNAPAQSSNTDQRRGGNYPSRRGGMMNGERGGGGAGGGAREVGISSY